MKLVIGLVVVGVIVIGIVYMFGGYRSFDPTAQGRQARASIKAGMTWNQVVSTAGEPRYYRVFRLQRKRVGPRDVETLVLSGQLEFDLDLFTSDMNKGNFKNGFVFDYAFSLQAAFNVHFDVAGRVQSVEDLATMADLLDQRSP